MRDSSFSAAVISVFSVSRPTVAVAMALSSEAVAPACRWSRYASLKATDPARAASGSPARKAISRTAVLGGTVTDTCETRSSDASAPSASAAATATSVDFTSWASVSRLTCPAVRAPVTAVSLAVGSTNTEEVDSYTSSLSAV